MSHEYPVTPEDLDASAGERICDTCEGDGELDESLGGPAGHGWVKCPDCGGKGWWNKVMP